MTDSSHSLSPLQLDLLDAFFKQTDRYFLTGGGALIGFYLRHRETEDLDLFATGDVDARDGVYALTAACAAIGAVARLRRESGDFRQFMVGRGTESTIVDLVIDRAPQIVSDKPFIGHVRIDPIREIAANKVCAILGRSVPRDLVDLKLLLDGGMRIADILADAQLKDAGADAANLAWILSQMRISPDAAFPAGVKGEDLEAFRIWLLAELMRAAVPKE